MTNTIDEQFEKLQAFKQHINDSAVNMLQELDENDYDDKYNFKISTNGEEIILGMCAEVTHKILEAVEVELADYTLIANKGKAKPGIFTPWAKVYCYKCHGPRFESIIPKTLTDEEMIEADQPIYVDEDNAITTCDVCGTEIQLISNVAGEHKLAQLLKGIGIEANLTQTGGMNSACEILKAGEHTLDPNDEYPPHFLVVHDWDGDGMWAMSEFDKHGQHVEESDYQCDSLEQMLGHIVLDVPTKPLEVE